MRYRKALNGLERNNEKMSVGLNDHGHFCLLRKNYFCLHLNFKKNNIFMLMCAHVMSLMSLTVYVKMLVINSFLNLFLPDL